MTKHPFTPATALLPHYVPSVHSVSEILIPFFSAVFITLLVAFILISRKPLPLSTKSLFLWFLLCGFIHFVIEGYFVYNNREIAGQTTFLADLWKEYSLSDSRYIILKRYMTSDAFIVLMEGITAFAWGPLSFLTAYYIYTDSPARHALQVIISLGQLYGDVLYYTTTLVHPQGHCDPHPFYFYFYFVFLNAFWIVIPCFVIWSTSKYITEACRLKQKSDQSKKLK